MTLFARRKRQREQVDAAVVELQQAQDAKEELEARVTRLEYESRVFMLKRKRELRQKGITC